MSATATPTESSMLPGMLDPSLAEQSASNDVETYKSLKRRFDELGEQGSDEAAAEYEEIAEERTQLLHRLLALESSQQHGFPSDQNVLSPQNDTHTVAVDGGQPSSSAEPPAKRPRNSLEPATVDESASDTHIDPALHEATSGPSETTRRRSTRARRQVNYNDDEVVPSPSPPPAKVEKPAPRKMKAPEAQPEQSPAAMAHLAPVPGQMIYPPVSNPPQQNNFNPYTLYYPPPGQSPPPFPHYYYFPGMMPYPPAMMPGPSQMHRLPQQQQPPPQQQQKLSDDPNRPPKAKRLKAHTVTSKSFSIPMVPRDKNGRPMLPLNVGIMTVISLGEVCLREHFHTERYIFPVGYEVTRRYMSTIDPGNEVIYHCTILDGGDGPKFQIVPNDVPDKPVIAGTATGAWSTIVKQANAIRSRQHSNSVSGPDFFGLGQNTIKHLIQQLPNADKLRTYVWQTFLEGGPLGGRHAAVIPALPEEYDSSTPIGAFYPNKRDKLQQDRAEERAASGEPSRSHYPPHLLAQGQQPTFRTLTPHQTPPPPPQQQESSPHIDPSQADHLANVTFADLLSLQAMIAPPPPPPQS